MAAVVAVVGKACFGAALPFLDAGFKGGAGGVYGEDEEEEEEAIPPPATRRMGREVPLLVLVCTPDTRSTLYTKPFDAFTKRCPKFGSLGFRVMSVWSSSVCSEAAASYRYQPSGLPSGSEVR